MKINKKFFLLLLLLGGIISHSALAIDNNNLAPKIILCEVSGSINPRLDCSPCHDYSSEGYIYSEKCLNTGCVCADP
jgi:hypothetical protein